MNGQKDVNFLSCVYNGNANTYTQWPATSFGQTTYGHLQGVYVLFSEDGHMLGRNIFHIH